MDLIVPEGESYQGFQEEDIRYALKRRRTLIADQAGLGKGHPVSSRIATPEGFTQIGDLRTGDMVIGSLGKPVRVTGIFDRGVLPVYKVLTNDGASTVVDGEHLWSVFDYTVDDFTTIETTEIAARVAKGEKFCLPMIVNPVDFSVKVIPDPTISALNALDETTFVEKLEAVDLRVFQTAAVWQRMAFLSAIIRAKGWVRGDDNHIRILLKDPDAMADLAETVIQITRSIGGLAFAYRNFRRIRIDLYLPETLWMPLIGYHRPKKRINRRWKHFVPGLPERTIIDVIPFGQDNVRCISVDAPDSLYVTDEFLLTHNTVGALGFSNNLPKVDSQLIVCLASHKEHWKRAVERWDTWGLSVDIAEGSYFPDTQSVVINYDILYRHYDAIRAGTWDVLIADEAHNLQNPDARRTQNVFGGKFKAPQNPDDPQSKKVWHKLSDIKAEREVYLTGTPIPNRVKNIWPLVKRMDPNGLGRNYRAFAYRYCGGYETGHGLWDLGSSHLDELREIMRRRFMVRHLKSDVLKDLPPKTRQVIPLSDKGLNMKLAAEKDALIELLRIYEDRHGIRPDADEETLAHIVMNANPQMFDDYAKTVDGELDKDTPLNKLAVARQELALAKVPMVIEHVSNLMEQGEKVVVFAYHRAVIEALRDRWSNSCACVYGATPNKKRQLEVDRFQEDPNCNPFIGQYTAAGTGYTMTAAHIVVCAELTWLPHELSQAEDRCHRIGQHDNVLVHHLIVKGSLDDTLLGSIVTKQAVIDQALDG